MKLILFTILFACCWIDAAATQVREKLLPDLVAESDYVLIATVAKVDMVNSKDEEISDLDARTGPGSYNTIRMHLKVHKDGILKTAAKDLPGEIVISLWQEWHSTLDHAKADERQEYIFLLKGDKFALVYPAGFMQPLSKRDEIVKLIHDASPNNKLPEQTPHQ